MDRISKERMAIALVATLPPLVVATHTLAELMRHWFSPDAPHLAYPIALAVIASAGLAMLLRNRLNSDRTSLYLSIIVAGLITLVMSLMNPGSTVSLIVVLLFAPAGTWVGLFLAYRLPSHLDGAVSRTPLRSYLWLLLGLLAMVQLVRLSSHVSDPDSEWWITTNNPFFAQHMCINAYVQAAELNRRGVENIYDRQYYPGINPDAKPTTEIEGLTPDDPYQYPPQFLLLPRLAIALTNSFHLIAVSWFAIQVFLFLLAAIWLSRAIGGKHGLTAALLLPAVWISFPVLSNLQYGQFHLASIVLAVIGMLAFSSRQYALGGATLAAAVLSKVAPGILLVYLVAQRRWKECLWTGVFSVLYSVLALWIIGIDQFTNFITYQLPRLQDGTAFAFADAWPDYIDLIIAGNQSPYGVILKLGALGLPGMSVMVARGVHLVYTLAVGLIAVLAARKYAGRVSQPIVWLALLNLASLVSKGAWGDYVAVGSIWLLTFVTAQIGRGTKYTLGLVMAWAFTALGLGIFPSPLLVEPKAMIVLSGIGAIIVVILNSWVIFRKTAVISESI